MPGRTPWQARLWPWMHFCALGTIRYRPRERLSTAAGRGIVADNLSVGHQPRIDIAWRFPAMSRICRIGGARKRALIAAVTAARLRQNPHGVVAQNLDVTGLALHGVNVRSALRDQLGERNIFLAGPVDRRLLRL